MQFIRPSAYRAEVFNHLLGASPSSVFCFNEAICRPFQIHRLEMPSSLQACGVALFRLQSETPSLYIGREYAGYIKRVFSLAVLEQVPIGTTKNRDKYWGT